MFDFLLNVMGTLGKTIAHFLHSKPFIVIIGMFVLQPMFVGWVNPTIYYMPLTIDQMWEFNDVVRYNLDVNFIFHNLPAIYEKYTFGDFNVNVKSDSLRKPKFPNQFQKKLDDPIIQLFYTDLNLDSYSYKDVLKYKTTDLNFVISTNVESWFLPIFQMDLNDTNATKINEFKFFKGPKGSVCFEKCSTSIDTVKSQDENNAIFNAQIIDYKMNYTIYKKYILLPLDERKVVIPQIENNLSFDLTPYFINNINLNFDSQSILNKQFKSFIEHELLPYIEANKCKNIYAAQILDEKVFYVNIYCENKLLYIIKLEDITYEKEI